MYDRVGVCGRVSLSSVRAEKRTERERDTGSELAMGELTISLRRTCRIRNILRVGYQNGEKVSNGDGKTDGT